MSRSARNRAARNLRDVPVRGIVGVHTPARPAVAPSAADARIRAVGYLGRNPTRVSYSGSGDAGYGSEWSRPMDFFTDRRWSATVNNREA